MLDRYMTGSIGGDCTASYKILLDKTYTVKTFIDAVISQYKTEWGSIEVTNGRQIIFSCGYRDGELTSEISNESPLDKTVISVNASGGWSAMDYIIRV